MSHRIAMLATACMALVLMFAAGCNPPEKQAVIEGDTVYLPKACSLFEETRSKPEDLPFVKFDGEHPSGWPVFAQLPEGTYLNPGGKLDWDPEHKGTGGRFKAICKMPQKELVAYFKAQVIRAGWTVEKVYDDEGAAYPTGQAAGDTTILAQGPDGPPRPYFNVTIWKHRNADGWVLFEGEFRSSW